MYLIVTRVHNIQWVPVIPLQRSTILAVQMGYNFGDSRKCDVPYVEEEKESVEK